MLILGSITSCLHSMRWDVSIVVQIALQDLNSHCMNINSTMNDSLLDGNTRPDHVVRHPELNCNGHLMDTSVHVFTLLVGCHVTN